MVVLSFVAISSDGIKLFVESCGFVAVSLTVVLVE